MKKILRGGTICLPREGESPVKGRDPMRFYVLLRGLPGGASSFSPIAAPKRSEGGVPRRNPMKAGAFSLLLIPVFLCLSAQAAATNAGAQEKPPFKFVFGAPAKGNVIAMAPTNVYSDAAGYGFEPGTSVVATGQSITSTNPFYFSVKLPEGNYRVTVTLGDPAGESTTTVKAELRRLMLEKVHTASGKTVTRSFIVNLRTPQIAGDGEVRLKSREKTSEWWDWDDKLTLEFNDARPCLDALEIEKADVPTVFLLGDSTVCDQPAEPWNSWGQMLPRFFKPDIAIANHAESGETIASSLGAHRFDKVFSLMKPGDYLIMQFGHNDMKSHATSALDLYRSNLKKVVAETRTKGGTPVLVTSMERKGGVEAPTLMGYPDAVREVAKEENCALIDLNAMSLIFYKALGADLAKAFQDGTHHNNYGSYELAKCVVEGIKQDKLPLAKFIVDDFKDFDPAHADPVDQIQMPASPRISNAKPLGN
jgi:lysophospholipase L1-like esterase